MVLGGGGWCVWVWVYQPVSLGNGMGGGGSAQGWRVRPRRVSVSVYYVCVRLSRAPCGTDLIYLCGMRACVPCLRAGAQLYLSGAAARHPATLRAGPRLPCGSRASLGTLRAAALLRA